MERRQLMQEYVQKSTTTTLLRSASRVSGLLFSQPVAPSSAGIGPSVLAGPADACADIIEPVFAWLAGAAAARIMAPPSAAGATFGAAADSRAMLPATSTG